MTIGNTGHLSIIIAFITALVAVYAYYKANQSTTDIQHSEWKRVARFSFLLHSLAVFSVVGCLFWIINTHQFQYFYAYDNSSLSLPRQYMISAFWQDQEGSFLLWIFWQAILGLYIVQRRGSWEVPVMVIFALVQAFLCSMILGIVLPWIDFKIGSSPFLLMKEAMPNLPVWKLKPDFVPTDGRGLNPLLQNYWMVIHPPTLFLGFATTLVPFAYCMAGLWTKRYTQWVRPALPYSLFSAVVLGVGILMGAYWAYETLNFGGYWNWDPVENAVYVPWLVMVAALHTMLIYSTNKTALRTSIFLIISQFILILYSTFLTRSGVLGNASVHSFTDLGLSGQLLGYLLVFLLLAVALVAWRWKQLPSDEKEISTYSREFWIFMGATVLCLAAFQVIVTTSIPVYNKILELFGTKKILALPADAIAHYTKFQLWFFVLIAILSGAGQYFWWRKAHQQNMGSIFTFPALAAAVLAVLAINIGGVYRLEYAVLLFAVGFSFFANGTMLLKTLKANPSLSGGAVAHTGVAFMLLGILFSAGYSKTISQNSTGMILRREWNTQENTDNQLLWLNRAEKLDKYLITYKGQRIEARNFPNYLPKEAVSVIEGDFRAVAQQTIEAGGNLYYKKGDTLEIYPENTYYEIEYREPNGKIFSLFPRIQINPQMGNAASPDIRNELCRDVYTHITDAPLPNAEKQWSATERFTVALKDTFFVNDYVAILDRVEPITGEIAGEIIGKGDAAIRATVKVFDKNSIIEISPVFLIKNQLVAHPAVLNEELGLRMILEMIDPKSGKFTFATANTQRDYVVMKAVEKPLINLLWLGTLVVVVGFSIATVRRFREGKISGEIKL